MKAIRLYAQVLVDAKAELSELKQFCLAANETPLFNRVFDNPTLGDEDKQKALSLIANQSGLSPIAGRFLSLLVRRNRMGLLTKILEQAEVLEIEKAGGLTGDLVSAIPVQARELEEIQKAFSKRLQKPVVLKQRVDASLLAGIRVSVSGVTYDGSIRGKLDKLAENF